MIAPAFVIHAVWRAKPRAATAMACKILVDRWTGVVAGSEIMKKAKTSTAPDWS